MHRRMCAGLIAIALLGAAGCSDSADKAEGVNAAPQSTADKNSQGTGEKPSAEELAREAAVEERIAVEEAAEEATRRASEEAEALEQRRAAEEAVRRAVGEASGIAPGAIARPVTDPNRKL